MRFIELEQYLKFNQIRVTAVDNPDETMYLNFIHNNWVAKKYNELIKVIRDGLIREIDSTNKGLVDIFLFWDDEKKRKQFTKLYNEFWRDYKRDY